MPNKKRVKELLAPHEKLIYIGHLHWFLFKESVITLILTTSLYYFSFVYFSAQLRDFLNIIITLLFFYAAFKFLLEYLKHNSSFFLITNERILIQVGLFKTSSMAISLPKIQTIEVNQTLFGQMLGYGTVTIMGVGINTMNKFDMVSNPNIFRQRLQTAIDGEGSEPIIEQTIHKTRETAPRPRPRR
ncbi:MAG: hypothetical protein EAZ85_01335 [Bacteroidetes bacterium]|nr:MAG: hypothetical protein EAZ85_01335 [Bacteroidota bacterium]TAG92570.1 MAG: hypothetical protein EAZ20_02415 [Bacteroidota bacterium]